MGSVQTTLRSLAANGTFKDEDADFVPAGGDTGQTLGRPMPSSLGQSASDF
jgi:hypothetical protein